MEVVKQFFIDWSATISALRVVATVVYVILTYHILAATRSITEITAKTFQILYRPYLAITSFQEEVERGGFTFTIKNVGQLPGTFSLVLVVNQKDEGDHRHILVPSEVLFPNTERTIFFPFSRLPASRPCPIITFDVDYSDFARKLYHTAKEVHFDPETGVMTDVRSHGT